MPVPFLEKHTMHYNLQVMNPRTRKGNRSCQPVGLWGNNEWEERDSLRCSVFVWSPNQIPARRLVCLPLQCVRGSSSGGSGPTIAFCFSFCSSCSGGFKETFYSVVFKWDFLNLSFLFRQLCFVGLGLFSVHFQLGKGACFFVCLFFKYDTFVVYSFCC